LCETDDVFRRKVTVMDIAKTTPAHALLHHKDRGGDHSTRKTGRGAVSAFASYGFGPMEMADGKGNKEMKPARGVHLPAPPVNHPGLSWIAQVQGMADSKPAAKESPAQR
jgi:hypothetical protein